MKKVLVIFGTRPEAIKMCPVVNELKKHKDILVYVCVSGQHREMLYSVLKSFNVIPDFDLNIMREEQTLFDITESILKRLKELLSKINPDLVLVHGDTSTAFAASLAAFYMGIKIGHVEAGLRSRNVFEPFPEEFNRRAISLISNYDFAPTNEAKANLIKEGKGEKCIFVTGNTVIDALESTVCEEYTHSELDWVGKRKLIILTSHRRENIGEAQKNIFRAVSRIAKEHQDICVIYPIHPNPIIKELAYGELSDTENVHIIDPLDFLDFHNFLARSYLILTDSGGIQEEASALGRPVLVLRNNTERPEGVECGSLRLVGTEERSVYKNFKLLLDDDELYREMSVAKNPYGDGRASERIVEIIERIL